MLKSAAPARARRMRAVVPTRKAYRKYCDGMSWEDREVSGASYAQQGLNRDSRPQRAP